MDVSELDPRPRSKAGRWALRGVLGLMAAGLAVHVLYGLLAIKDPLATTLIGTIDYDALLLGSGLICVARAVTVRAQRPIWALLGAGMVLYAAGDISWSLLFKDVKDAPYPSVSDALWLSAYVPAYVALGLLVKTRLHGLQRSQWLDGLIGALVVAVFLSLPQAASSRLSQPTSPTPCWT